MMNSSAPARTAALLTKSKIPTPRPVPTTGTPKTLLRQRFLRLRPHPAAAPTATAPIPAPRGAKEVVAYLHDLAHPIKPNCDAGHYYILNNYNPGYFGDGSSATSSAAISDPGETVFAIPGSPVRSIGDALMAKGVSFAYYGDQWNTYLANTDNTYVTADNTFCNICDPFLYSTLDDDQRRRPFPQPRHH